MPSPTAPVRLGVLLISPTQLLDVSPIDLFGMLTAPYLTACRLPAPLIALAVPVEIIYIAESGAGRVAELTASAGLRVTASLADDACQPGKLDVLMVPGPDPQCVPSEAVKRFMREHAEVKGGGGADVLTVCTGVFVAGEAGLLDGKRATGPRALLPELRDRFPGARFEAKRWVRDGKLWTSAGITNGLDMVAEYIRTRWPGPTAEAVLAMADVGDRSQEYRNGTASENAWWVWQILRAWRKGLFM